MHRDLLCWRSMEFVIRFSDAKDVPGLSGPSGSWRSRRRFGGGRHQDFWTPGLSLDLLWQMIWLHPLQVRTFL